MDSKSAFSVMRTSLQLPLLLSARSFEYAPTGQGFLDDRLSKPGNLGPLAWFNIQGLTLGASRWDI